MGCRTGCCLVMFGDLNAEDACGLAIEMCGFTIGFSGEIPGARPERCGNCLEQSLSMARRCIARYKNELAEQRRLAYPRGALRTWAALAARLAAP